ncbi:FAD-dependent oxidoreductase [Mycobacterium sp. 1274756.6]|uniref:FAD-dependent oxidoreductase n=1 Tax=Mycobacterium sp. 1274756.6 TaxID=1834076 RepID=UPI0008003D9A|nr:FAD-dependent oxidoreductase [Mycobacterium sp. 1274756.6]OBJ73563.1 FAD-binding monooxygenase [Mycobacterium sp. 1274756.6]
MARRIVIVGAGIAGLATALGLQRAGYEITVVERRTDTSTGAGISIWPNALAALDLLGAGDAVREAGGRITAGAVRWKNGSWLRRPAPERIVRALGEPLVVVQRSVLRDILTAALTTGTVAYGRSVAALTDAAAGVRLRFSDGSEQTVDAVVGADGTNSAVARHLNGPLPQRYTGYTAWRGIAEYVMNPDLSGLTLAPGVETGHVPMGANRTYWFTTQRTPEGSQAPNGELDYLRSEYAEWAEPIPDILAATAPDNVLRDDLYDRATARQWARGPIVLVGDAAHPMRPHLGQGGCQGLEDAAILAACVDDAADLPSAFARFVAVRRPRLRRLVRESARIGKVLNARPGFLGAVLTRASVLVPETVVMRHMATVAGRSAFVLPTGA